MKIKLALLLCAVMVATVTANEKYLMTRQPGGKAQVADVIETTPNSFLVADETGRLKARPISPTDVIDLWGSGVYVKDFAGLQAGLVGNKKRIILAADMTVTSNVTVPQDRTVVFNGYKLKEGSTQTITFMGTVEAGRYQIFEGWEAGDIRGTFGADRVFPEWWGLVGSNANDGQHDIAINCAAKSFVIGANGVNVSLAAGFYWVSKPIDLRGTHSRLKGSGSGQTFVWATNNWSPPVWDKCSAFSVYATRGQTAFSVVDSADSGANITLTVEAGGTKEMYVGRSVRVTNSSIPGYQGVHPVVSVPSHNTVKLGKTFVGNATGTVTPVTLDSVMEFGDNSHSALVWLGSINPGGGEDFHTGVEGVYISGYYAIRKWPLKRVSGISWTGYVQELSPIRDVAVSGFSGFGIGGQNPDSIGTVNGMSITNFNISNATRRGAIPIYVGGHSGVMSIRDGTIDCGVIRSQTHLADSPPVYQATWPQFGMYVTGLHATIDNVHIEGCGTGIHVWAWDGSGGASISNVDTNHMMDNGMVYTEDGTRPPGPAPELATQEVEDNLRGLQPFIFHHSCVVSLGRPVGNYLAAHNYNSTVSVRNIRSGGSCKYLLRDWVYGVDQSSFGGREPNSDTNALAAYDRGVPIGLATGTYPNMVVGAGYNKNSPATDKTYFTLVP